MPEAPQQFSPRPPIVVVMGHIDHGKTTLLDFIRKTKTAAKESGGITQHIGAYQVEHRGKKITFLDTPGHEAFSAIRSRGARVADIAVVVVACDEGVKPQTLEALALADKAELPLVVALTKIDKPTAQPDKAKGELAEQGVLVEGWGGTIPAAEISAVTGQGIENLLELIALTAEIDLPAADATPSAEGTAAGIVIESSLDQRRGALATLIPESGTLTLGDAVASGRTFGRIRIMEDWEGRAITSAAPGFPARAIGLKEPAEAGDTFRVFPTIQEAERAAQDDYDRRRSFEPTITTLVSGKKEHVLSLVLRADTQGSLEGIVQALKTLPIARVGIEIIKTAVGSVSDSDIKLAEPKKTVVMGFRVAVEPQARLLAEQRGVTVTTFEVIYEIIEFVRKEMALKLPPEIVRNDLGRLTVLAEFKQTPRGWIIGGKVSTGKIRRGALAEVTRGSQLMGRGKIVQIQQAKADAEEVLEGRECGALFEGTTKPAVGDTLVVFEEIVKPQEL